MVEPPYRIKNMMPGMIMLWHGAIADIPSGWAFCDGTMGTPDLRYRFVKCPNIEAQVGVIGGASTHVHTFTGDGHSHLLPAGTDIAAGADFDKDTNSVPAVGTTDLGYNDPKFMYLCYIMKL